MRDNIIGWFSKRTGKSVSMARASKISMFRSLAKSTQRTAKGNSKNERLFADHSLKKPFDTLCHVSAGRRRSQAKWLYKWCNLRSKFVEARNRKQNLWGQDNWNKWSKIQTCTLFSRIAFISSLASKLPQLPRRIRKASFRHCSVVLVINVHVLGVSYKAACFHQQVCSRGSQERMFFLFSDILLYAKKGGSLDKEQR